ncbi:hypothetical protein C9374_002946 [Naegleria lovaniensis]|uniref:Uncharacterized protein n=1 Tax=Naegleria lovaniensis TaxID=51637 RepID=A0AA88KPW2_NAELO|nr:uncharacterized protein C9374_002946 [Naegleria lovaniensis]KAG2385797.1 hypothetical protein C9374_002946 [Naegleria lovaniensis]
MTDQPTPQITSSSLYFMGSNQWYQSGIPGLPSSYDCVMDLRPVPTPWQNSEEINKVACGAEYTLVLLKNGKVFGAGYNGYGQCGTKSEQSFQEFKYLSGLQQFEPIRNITTGAEHTVAISAKFEVIGSGYNSHNELGENQGHNSFEFKPIQPLMDLIKHHEGTVEIADISCGSWTTSVLTKNGNVYTCGEASSENTEPRKMNISCVKELFSGERVIYCRDILNDFYVLTDEQTPVKILIDTMSIFVNRLFCNVDEEDFIGYEIFEKSTGKWYLDMKNEIGSEISGRTLRVESRENSFLIASNLELCNGEPMSLIKDIVYCCQAIIVLMKDNTLRAFETERTRVNWILQSGTRNTKIVV